MTSLAARRMAGWRLTVSGSADRMAAIVQSGIPAMGHLGLTPQSTAALGGFRVQAREVTAAKRLVGDAQALEEAGAFAILLECVPTKVAGLIARRASIPIISIGAGIECDGQCLIFHDMFGLYPKFTPKFSKQYANVADVIVGGLGQYVEDVRRGRFPEPKHSFSIADQDFRELEAALGSA